MIRPVPPLVDQKSVMARPLVSEIEAEPERRARLQADAYGDGPLEVARSREYCVGIINAMLMSVTERIREIGTMKCLGALDAFILKIYFIEAALQGLIGTAMGTGWAAGKLAAFRAAGKSAAAAVAELGREMAGGVD